MLAQNTILPKIRIQSQSKSRVWSQWKSSEAISNHNVGLIIKVSTFDDIVFKKDLHRVDRRQRQMCIRDRVYIKFS